MVANAGIGHHTDIVDSEPLSYTTFWISVKSSTTSLDLSHYRSMGTCLRRQHAWSFPLLQVCWYTNDQTRSGRTHHRRVIRGWTQRSVRPRTCFREGSMAYQRWYRIRRLFCLLRFQIRHSWVDSDCWYATVCPATSMST